MRVVHLSDLHLGFRAFPAADQGWNLRERDILDAFQRAIDEVARLRPHLLLLTGDIFDRPDPPTVAILALTRGLGTLQSRAPGVRVLAIAGERDTPRDETDPGPVAILDALPGVRAAASAPRAVRFREQGVHALLVPARALAGPALPELRPDPEARHNLLLIRARDGRATPLPPFSPEEWDYVAIGGPHRTLAFERRVGVPGSLERVGWDPWSEATVEKGFLSVELGSGEAEFHPVPIRPIVDLAPVRVDRNARIEGTRRLRHLIEALPGGVEGRIVRVRLSGDVTVPEEGVEPGLLEGIRRRAAHLDVSVEPSAAGGRSIALPLTFCPGEEGASGSVPTGGIHLLNPESEAGLVRHLVQWDSQAGESEQFSSLLRVGGPAVELFECIIRLAVKDLETIDPDPLQDPSRADASESAKLERELRDLRGDAVEAEGDVEARALEWARDRQEAETRLQSYRDRARELRRSIRYLEVERPRCPTCGVALGKRRSELLATLREEWEMVVQDGRWWKRRREQLEERPLDLREMEGRALRLRARADETSARLERIRALPSRSGSSARTLPAGSSIESTMDSEPFLAFLAHASSALRQWTEGRLSGVARGPGGEPLVLERGVARPPQGDEDGALRLALHLGLVAWVAERVPEHRTLGPVLLRGLDARGLDPLLPWVERLPLEGLTLLVVLPAEAPLPESPLVCIDRAVDFP